MPAVKSITVHYRPELALEPFVIQTSEKSGYNLEEQGSVPTYRLFAGSKTHLFPASVVLRIEMEL